MRSTPRAGVAALTALAALTEPGGDENLLRWGGGAEEDRAGICGGSSSSPERSAPAKSSRAFGPAPDGAPSAPAAPALGASTARGSAGGSFARASAIRRCSA